MTNLNIRRPLTAIEEEEDLQRAIELSRLANSTPVTPVFKQNPDSGAYQVTVSFVYSTLKLTPNIARRCKVTLSGNIVSMELFGTLVLRLLPATTSPMSIG